jgi:DNA-binding NtrC family response regulator
LSRVLVIDDQADVRTMVSIVLRINRFEVTEVAGAAAGLAAFESSQFDLAIVDIFLQETNGLDVIGKMRERDPDFPVVAISGMMALDLLAESPELSNIVCLQKPFRPAELIRAIETAINSRPPVAANLKTRGESAV